MKLGNQLRTFTVEPLRLPVPERTPDEVERERAAVVRAGSDAPDGERRS